MSKRINPYNRFNGSFVPEWILAKKEISAGAKLCYSRLARFSGKNGKCFPKIETIANALGVSKRQCSSYLKELKDVDLIESKQRGLGNPNQYFFLDHRWIYENDKLCSDDSDTSSQGGSIVHDRDEEDFNTDMKDTSSPIYKESHNKESHNKESKSARVCGCPIPKPLQVEGFKKRYEAYWDYMMETYTKRASIPAVEAHFRKLIELQQQGNDPLKVIDQTMSANNKSFYALKDFDSDDSENSNLFDQRAIMRTKRKKYASRN